MSDKPTREVDQLEVIRQMLERSATVQESLATHQEALSAKVDAQRAEADARGARLEGNIDVMRGEFRVLAGRVDTLEMRVRHIGDKGDETARQSSSVDLEHEAAIGGAVAHIAKVDERTADMAEVQENHSATLRAHGEALQIVVRELGVEASLPTPTGSIPPPGDRRKAVAVDKLKANARWTGAATVIALVIARLVEILLARASEPPRPPQAPTHMEK